MKPIERASRDALAVALAEVAAGLELDPPDQDWVTQVGGLLAIIDAERAEVARLRDSQSEPYWKTTAEERSETIDTLQAAIDMAAEALIGDGCEFDPHAIGDELAPHVSPYLKGQVPTSVPLPGRTGTDTRTTPDGDCRVCGCETNRGHCACPCPDEDCDLCGGPQVDPHPNRTGTEGDTDA